MTNGDSIRSKLTDEFIAEHCFCAVLNPGPDCEGCPLEEVRNCVDFGVRMRYLGEENTEKRRKNKRNCLTKKFHEKMLNFVSRDLRKNEAKSQKKVVN